jgi:Ca2+-binding EF-hand superfamily protein
MPQEPSGGAPVASAQAPTEVPAFGELDRDGDGGLNREEARVSPPLLEIFSLSDSDQDGRLNVAEYSQATIEGMRVSPDAARGPLFPALDTDENGRLSAEEAAAVPQLAERFERFDVDGSGGLDVGEYDTALEEGIVGP